MTSCCRDIACNSRRMAARSRLPRGHGASIGSVRDCRCNTQMTIMAKARTGTARAVCLAEASARAQVPQSLCQQDVKCARCRREVVRQSPGLRLRNPTIIAAQMANGNLNLRCRIIHGSASRGIVSNGPK